MQIKISSVALALALAATNVQAFWRMNCLGRVDLARFDPIVAPGQISGHVHTFQGPNTLHPGATCDDLMQGTCSTCEVRRDLSAYWVPSLYYQHPDGKFESVGQKGGMLIYYLLRGDNIQPFPKGFQMIAGDPSRRSKKSPKNVMQKSTWTAEDRTQLGLEEKAISFNCLNYEREPEGSHERNHFPQDAEQLGCKHGIRAELFFPSCWDGKNLDMPDHKSHMAYPDGMNTGECPPSHPIRLPSLFFETIFDVAPFFGKGGRYVFSHGDPTGYGFHGDFQNGWDQDVLTRAIKECRNVSGKTTDCPVFLEGQGLRSKDEMLSCKVPKMFVQEAAEGGKLDKIPGCITIHEGPDPAPKGMACNENGQPIGAKSSKPVPAPAPEPTPAPETKPEPAPEPEPESAPKVNDLDSDEDVLVKSDPAPTPAPAPAPAPEGPSIPEVSAKLADEGKKVVVVTVTSTTTVTCDVTTTLEKRAEPTAFKHRKLRRHGHGHRHH